MKNKIDKLSIRGWVMPVLFLLIVCSFAIGSSPIYRTNPWVDSNAMLTMGKAMLNGNIPFKDIIDQRGPVLYAIFALGALIRKNSFSGVFLMQVVNVLAIYVLTWKMANNFKFKLIDSKWIALMGPMVLFSTNAFSFSGSPEEFAFTSILYLLLVINRVKQNVENITLKEFFLLGINLSLVFWNKFSMVGAFVGFFIWVAGLLIYKKQFMKLAKVVLISLLGFMTVTILVFIYFAINNAWGDLIQIYFVQNLTSYGKSNQTLLMKLWSLLFLLGQEISEHVVVAGLIVAGWIKAFYNKKSVILEIVLFLSTILFVALQHWINEYYNLVWISFLIVSLLRLTNIKLSNSEDIKKIKLPIQILVVMSLILLPFVNNKDLSKLIIRGEDSSIMHYQYNAQPQFAQIMRSKEKHPKLLMINDLDEGFYLSADTLPTTKYWQKLNMTYEQLPRMYNSFNQDLKNKKVDFVIVRINDQIATDMEGIHNQIPAFVDGHLIYQLFKNYRIEAVSRNNWNDNYVLMYKK
ncbi:teichoic acid glycosyl transferase [Companilactobacillus zhachilii]|uniref:Teichoic acid glycosyl transferase n=1 Tax=Companilactobacillus zhachilii TaxID=2304606 RepID=A0A386PSN8_9LACO|nr:teichoic acid glycosyl transferase [Companilactobacillus zhachilii]AYE39061.1 teichoic acid glycosyl transferase [Companilactobacillus zhachilii]